MEDAFEGKAEVNIADITGVRMIEGQNKLLL